MSSTEHNQLDGNVDIHNDDQIKKRNLVMNKEIVSLSTSLNLLLLFPFNKNPADYVTTITIDYQAIHSHKRQTQLITDPKWEKITYVFFY